MEEKIKLGFYPYTYARVSAMKGKLIREDDYNRLMKMKISEITKFLQETEYRKEIDEMAVSHDKIPLIEAALNRNMVRHFSKLRKIATGSLALLISSYLRRRDIQNLKTIIRGKLINAKEDYIKSLLIPVGDYDEKYLEELMKKENVEEILTTLKGLKLKDSLKDFKETGNLFEIENLLERYYYKNTAKFIETIPQGTLFREFLQIEIDILNITTLLRLKKEKFGKEDINKYLLYGGKHLGQARLQKLVQMERAEDIVESLKATEYGKIIGEAEEAVKKGNLSEVEVVLNRYLLGKTALLLHQHPLSIDVILGYMFAKEMEIRNLKTIIKGKQLGLEEGFIEKELVIAI